MLALLLNLQMLSSASPPWFSSESDPDLQEHDFDTIVVLGGGLPTSADEPPVFVKNRCEAAFRIYRSRATDPSRVAPVVLTLSAGTAHTPQLLTACYKTQD